MQTESTQPRHASARRADLLLLVVVAISVVLAMGSVVDDAGSLPDGAFASVNGEVLPAAQLDLVLARLESQLGRPPDPAERAEVIARLVDEELLLQQGLALGLVRADTRLRSQLVQDVIGQATAASAATPVEEAALRDFLQHNAGYFRRPETYRVERYHFAREADAEHAASGGPTALAKGDRDVSLPSAALTEARLRDYLGSSLAGQLASLPDGGFLTGRDASGAAFLIRLAARVAGGVPELRDIRPLVETEYRRRRDEDALRVHVERLRRDAKIITPGSDSE